MNTPDVALGSFVFCSQHCCAHSTGWCTVGNEDKVALKATTLEEAIEESKPIKARQLLLLRIEKSIKHLDEIPPTFQAVGVVGERARKCRADTPEGVKRWNHYTKLMNEGMEHSSDVRMTLMMLRDFLSDL